jgi:hypothetical protein
VKPPNRTTGAGPAALRGGRRHRLPPPDQAAKPRQQLPQLEGFADVVVGPDLEPHDAVHRLAERGDHDDAGHLGLAPQSPRDGKPAFPRQVEVEQHDLDRPGGERRVQRGAVRAGQGVVALRAKVFDDDLPQVGLVLHHGDADASRHVPRGSCCSGASLWNGCAAVTTRVTAP